MTEQPGALPLDEYIHPPLVTRVQLRDYFRLCRIGRGNFLRRIDQLWLQILGTRIVLIIALPLSA